MRVRHHQLAHLGRVDTETAQRIGRVDQLG
ncbi:MAG: hypothetical protein JWQ60_2822, partial [Pseudonocardia sp.]|nr:hypothetical protein [Pseudonocardia sp.]